MAPKLQLKETVTRQFQQVAVPRGQRLLISDHHFKYRHQQRQERNKETKNCPMINQNDNQNRNNSGRIIALLDCERKLENNYNVDQLALKHLRSIKTRPREMQHKQQKSFLNKLYLSSSAAAAPSPSECLIINQTRTKIVALFSAVAFILLLSFAPSHASPPVDYFVHTSQLAKATNESAAIITSLLPSIKSIYELSPDSSSTSSLQADQADKLAAHVLSLVRNREHSHDNDLVDLEATRYAWSLMEKQARLYMRNRVASFKPLVDELLDETQVSSECSSAIKLWLNDLIDLKHWAVLMWNSWGDFPPAGLFEGSFTDLGSYRGCMSIEDNSIIDQAQYCMLDFQPIIPSRPRFHSIFKRILSMSETSQHLVGGDFYNSQGDHLGTKHTSHGFSSTRYNKLYQSSQAPKFSAKTNGDDIDATLVAAALTVRPDETNKYSKRTIEQNQSLNSTLSNSIADLTQQSNNLTLKAEAFMELALKAQYFYYVKFRLGACLPAKCSKDDVQKLALGASQRAILQSTNVNCMKREPFSVNNYQLVAIWILSILAFIALLGTLVDVLGFKESQNNTSSTLVDWLLPFSIWTNSKRLFDFETAGTHGDLECVHGLRFFSMVWVIYGHTILYMEYQSFTHFYDVIETQIPSFILLPSLNANFSVDTFFVISGILTTYVTWEYTKGDYRKFNKFAFMISRYIRLTPQLAIVILCFFLLPLFGDGPMYKYVADDKAQVCYKNWGINLLYLQSYINSEKLCIDPSWWLSIEMSFHVISVLVIIVMIKNVRQGMIVNFIVAAVLTLWGATIHYTNGFAIQYLPSIPQRYEVSGEQTKLFFHRPYPHAASYFIGIALGYVLANRTIKKLSQIQLVYGWIICTFGFAISLLGSYYWNLGAPYTQIQATLYYNLCQILWPISIAWIILACSLGHGGYVNSILSARCFVPLGRITYMTYLSHALIIYYHSGRMHITVEPSMLFFTYLFIANTALSLVLGVILTVVYESPILNLQKLLFTYLTRKFDPTLRDARAIPTNHRDATDGRRVFLAETTDDTMVNGATIIIPNGCHPEKQNNNTIKTNGYISKTPTATCLLLNSNHEKRLAKSDLHINDGSSRQFSE